MIPTQDKKKKKKGVQQTKYEPFSFSKCLIFIFCSFLYFLRNYEQNITTNLFLSSLSIICWKKTLGPWKHQYYLFLKDFYHWWVRQNFPEQLSLDLSVLSKLCQNHQKGISNCSKETKSLQNNILSHGSCPGLSYTGFEWKKSFKKKAFTSNWNYEFKIYKILACLIIIFGKHFKCKNSQKQEVEEVFMKEITDIFQELTSQMKNSHVVKLLMDNTFCGE